jgi:hypothetical protein
MGTSCCSKITATHDTDLYNRNKTIKKSEVGTSKEVKEEGFVEILHKDGSYSEYVHPAVEHSGISGSELVSVHAETIDMKKALVQLPANEKVLTLKQKICESLCFNDALLVLAGKILDIGETVGNSVTQGCRLDVLAI